MQIDWSLIKKSFYAIGASIKFRIFTRWCGGEAQELFFSLLMGVVGAVNPYVLRLTFCHTLLFVIFLVSS